MENLTRSMHQGLRDAFSRWRLQTIRIKCSEKHNFRILLQNQKLELGEVRDQYSSTNLRLELENDRLQTRISDGCEVEQQVATLLREINILKIRLEDRTYEQEMLKAENQRSKEELMFKSGYGKFESYETLNPSISKLSRNMSSTTGSSYMKFRQTLQTNKENYLSYSNLSSKGSKF